MDKLEKQVSRLPKKDLSKGQRSLLSFLAQGTRLSLSFSLCLPKKLIIQLTYNFEIYISTRIRASVSIILILQHLIDILQQ